MDRHIGSKFDDFLQEDGRLIEANAVAVKRVIAWQIGEAMREQKVTKKAMAERMSTSRAQLNRILDGADPALTLESLTRAASVLGRRVRLELSPA